MGGVHRRLRREHDPAADRGPGRGRCTHGRGPCPTPRPRPAGATARVRNSASPSRATSANGPGPADEGHAAEHRARVVDGDEHLGVLRPAGDITKHVEVGVVRAEVEQPVVEVGGGGQLAEPLVVLRAAPGGS